MVQLVILARELSPLKGEPDQFTGFPTGGKNMGMGEPFKIGWGGGDNTWGHGGGGGASKKRENKLRLSQLK